MKESRILMKPMYYVQIFLILTILFYFFGPISWPTNNPIILVLFLFLAQFSLFLGYFVQMSKLRVKYINFDKRKSLTIVKNTTIKHYLKYMLFLNLIILVLYLLRNTGQSSFSLTAIINNIRLGLTSASEQYYLKFDTEISARGRIIGPIVTVSSFFLWSAIPLAIYFFRELTKFTKILLILNIFFELSRWISTGTNKGIVDLVLIIGTIMWVKSITKVKDTYSLKKIFFTIVLFVMMFFTLSYFTENIRGRTNDSFSLEIDTSNILLRSTPENLKYFIVYSNGYLTQGYYGLSLALSEPFKPMYGSGSSFFIMSHLSELLDKDLYQLTYQSRIEYRGWDSMSRWHSIYTWFANDFSFLGTIVLMYFIGRYFAIISFRTIKFKDPIFTSLFCMMIIMFFYFPANNQVFQSPITTMGFLGLNFYWFYKTFINKKDIIIRLKLR